jgi:rhodanese-related sulfurtransferase
LKEGSTLLSRFASFFLATLIVTFAATVPRIANAQMALLFGDLSWARINAYLDKEYPDVTNISTQELAGLIGITPSGITLLDTRAAEEFNASHLPSAKRYDSATNFIGTLPKATPIVVYCSVGVRSAAIAKQLKANGFTNVKNLRGSAFMWANEGRPLEGPAAPKVHPFNTRWGNLLEPSLRLTL